MHTRICLAAALLACGWFPADAANPLKTGPSVRALAFSPDGKVLAATSSEPEEVGHATAWEWSSGKLLFSHQESQGIPSAAFSPDGKRLVFGSFTENARVIDTAKWAVERQLPGHGKAARGFAFSHDGKTLAVTSYDGFIRLWDVPTWSVRKTLEKVHDGWVYAAAFSKDGKTLASSSADSTAKLWDVETGANLHTFKHDSIVRRIFFTPDDRHVVYTSWDGSLAIRARDTGQWVVDFSRYGAGDDVALTADGTWLAVASSSSAMVWPIDLRPADEALLQRVRRLVSAWDDDRLSVRDQATQEATSLGIPALAALRQAAKESPSPEVRLRARLARAAISGAEPRWRLRHPEGNVLSVAFSPDGQTLATGGPDGIVRLWNATTGQEIRVLRQFAPTKPRVPRSEY